VEVANEVGLLVEKKNAAYGNSFVASERVLAALYPNGVGPEGYGDFLAITRVVDKLFRIATDRDAFGEDPWRDIAGYAVLAVRRRLSTRAASAGAGESSPRHGAVPRGRPRRAKRAAR
jgi:hypothetical protein